MPKKLTTEEFISRAIAKHGEGRYCYDNVIYERGDLNVEIICPVHGAYYQRASIHLAGHGCPRCAIDSRNESNRKTTEDFIKKAKLIHGESYCYDSVKYNGCDSHVEIICPLHGPFLQTPTKHLQGSGCPMCNKTHKKTTEEFIIEAQKVHGNKYDYSLVDYVNDRTNVKIICPKHGIFEQLPTHHLRKSGCRKCYDEKNSRRRLFDQSLFIQRVKDTHGDTFDYSKSIYKGMRRKLEIICRKHGSFWQTPHMHLQGHGCPKCIGKFRTTEEFIKMAKEVHGDRYDYSKTEYKGFNEKVLIICPKHGDFQQNSYVHLTGSGCPYCKNSKGEDAIAHFLKKHGIKYIPQYRFTNNYSFCENKYIYVDFFLPNDSIIIEFNGLQHYGAVDFWGGEKVFQKQKNRDETVRMYCKDNNIRLLEIPYTKMGDINILIEDFLKVISH
jgi:hypothetical protein